MNGSYFPRKFSLPKFAALVLALCVLPLQAVGQAAQNQPGGTSQLKPVSLPHLYWHFLIHQNFLDSLSAKLSSEGKGGQELRNDLQNKLGFSDTEFSPIRTASQRLTAELQPIDDQLKALRKSQVDTKESESLIAKRETYINDEVYNLSIELSPKNKFILEKFMAQFFAPKTVTAVSSTTASGNSTGGTVQP